MIVLSRKSERGFTLIEVIVGLVVFGILAILFVSFLGSPLQDSSLPVVRLKNSLTLQQVMENIRADFKANQDLAALKTAIDAGSYGSYIVEQNDYIKYSGTNEVADTTDLDLLKVSIKSTTDDFTLTLLFSVW